MPRWRRVTPGRWLPAGCIVLAIGLVGLGVASVAQRRAAREQALDQALLNEVGEQAVVLDEYFARARSITLITARNPAFAQFYTLTGTREQKLQAGGPAVVATRQALANLELLFPDSIGEACFIDFHGSENARAVGGADEDLANLSPDEARNPFFAPTFELDKGEVYQAAPYVSPDTHEWVISNSTPIVMPDGTKPGIVHFEVTIESFRGEAAKRSERFEVQVLDARTGQLVVDSDHEQRAPGEEVPLGVPDDRSLDAIVHAGRTSGIVTIDGRRRAYRRVAREPHNENEWIVVASDRAAAPSFADGVGVRAVAALVAAVALLGLGVSRLRHSQRRLRHEADTDSLTGLANRRRLIADLEAALEEPGRRWTLALFDLDGFKSYNDVFGHPAGDALLTRLAASLAATAAGRASAYRMGGDEFCVLAPHGEVNERIVADAAAALHERGEGFEIGCSFGAVLLPEEAMTVPEALRVADVRMYAHKGAGRPSAGRQATDALLQALFERDPDLGEHVDGVADLAHAVGERLGLPPDLLPVVAQAARLHDIGKMAIPDSILGKAGPLDDAEWAFMRRHTIIGERILLAAPALAPVAALVRSSHERYDGGGYPDGLAAADIPLAARIIAVCDAFDAMSADRPYRRARPLAEAVAELRAGAGTQFDPDVVDVFAAVVEERRRLLVDARP